MKLSCQYSHIIDTFEFLLLSRGGQERNLGFIVSPEQSFWCGWGHRCHGNKFWCGGGTVSGDTCAWTGTPSALVNLQI